MKELKLIGDVQMSKQLNKTNILNYLKEHTIEFKNKYNVEKIGLFGSYAKDEATPESDIDIFVQMRPSLFDMVAIKEQIEQEVPHIKKNAMTIQFHEDRLIDIEDRSNVN